MFLVFYICRLLLLPHGVRNFGTKSIREIWFVTSVPSSADSGEGHTKNLSLEENCVLFCGLHIVAKWSCFIYVISDLFCRMSICYFCILFTIFASMPSLMQSWLNGRERSYDLKGLDNWEFHSESSSIMADLVQFDYESKSVGLTPTNHSKTTIAQFLRLHEEGLHLTMVKNGKCENLWPLSNGKFLLPTRTKNAHVVAFPAEDQYL